MQQDNKPDNKTMNSMGRPARNQPKAEGSEGPTRNDSTAQHGSQPKVKDQPKMK